MNCNPLVSIIVPLYNVEPYIEQCCRSVFAQTYGNCEFIFVDDCGTDKSMDILNDLIKEYSHLKERIRIIHHDENKGLATARRTGISAARGEWVQFVDSDDYIAKDMTGHLVEIALKNDADIVVCDYDSGYYDMKHEDADNVKALDNIECMCLGLQSNVRYVVFWNKLFRRDLLYCNKLYAPPRVWCDEDSCVMYRAFYMAKTVMSTSRSLYYYRKVGTSMSNSYKKYRGTNPAPVLQMVEIMNSFVKEHGITDERILDSMNLYKLGLLRLLALYVDAAQLKEKRYLFDSVTVSFALKHWRTKWSYVLVFLTWKSGVAWMLDVLRFFRDNHWYVG